MKLDDSEMSKVPTMSNIRKDLTEWQEKHANLVLHKVKEMSRLRYELCLRVMKERKFWRIYFILMNSYVAPYEKRYMEEAEKKCLEVVKNYHLEEPPNVGMNSRSEDIKSDQKSKMSTSLSTEQDLDVFLMGGDSDEGPDHDDDYDDGTFDDDFDKLVKSSDDDQEKS